MPFNPMLFVNDVETSSRWYQDVLGFKGAHGGKEYEMIVDDERRLLLQLHHADAEEHGGDRLPTGAPRGAGVLLYLDVPDVRAAYARAQGLGATTEGPPQFVRQAGHTEFVVRDPDGYALAITQRGEA